MGVINSILNAVFNVIFAPFRGMNPWVAMLVISLGTGILMIFIYKLVSDQAGILRTKNLIKAHLLELRLYKDSMAASFRSYGAILWANVKYVGHALRPLLVMIIPVLLILIQLNSWFGYRSLREGEPFLLKVKLAEGRDPMQTNLQVQPSETYTVETPALRMQEEREIDWRLRPTRKGLHEIAFDLDGTKIIKTLAVEQRPLSRISPLRPGGKFMDVAFNPSEPGLAKGSPITSIEVAYPEARLDFLGIHFHWLVAFFILSIIFGFGLKGLFRVEI
jgi:uncharacterized membrane protein (DUF106 family)